MASVLPPVFASAARSCSPRASNLHELGFVNGLHNAFWNPPLSFGPRTSSPRTSSSVHTGTPRDRLPDSLDNLSAAVRVPHPLYWDQHQGGRLRSLLLLDHARRADQSGSIPRFPLLPHGHTQTIKKRSPQRLNRPSPSPPLRGEPVTMPGQAHLGHLDKTAIGARGG